MPSQKKRCKKTNPEAEASLISSSSDERLSMKIISPDGTILDQSALFGLMISGRDWGCIVYDPTSQCHRLVPPEMRPKTSEDRDRLIKSFGN